MAGFERAGLPGIEHLRQALSNSSDLAATIESFQHDNGILLPSLQSALPFLDLHGVRRLDFHSSVMEHLRESVLEKVKDLSTQKLEEILEQSFPFIHVKELRPVVVAVMKHLPKINDECLEHIANDAKLYEDCPIEVKRQIWSKHHHLFGDAVGPLLNQYIEAKYTLLHSTEAHNSHSFFSVPSKTRRQHAIVQGLAKMIGKSLSLYNLVLQFLRTLFLRANEVHYCTLRSELLMAVHDLEVKDIKDVDPCHKFTWCLDACIREKSIEGKRVRELQGFLEMAKNGEERVLGDIAMILCDPFAINTIAKSIIKLLHRLANTDTLPRTSEDITFLLRLLNLGVSAWDMIEKQAFKEIPVNDELASKFLPFIMSLMVDSSLNTLNGKVPEDDIEEGLVSDGRHLAHHFMHMMVSNKVAFKLAWCFMLHLLHQKDKAAVFHALPWYVSPCQAHPLDEIELHILVTALVGMQEEFNQSEFCDLIFDNFLLGLTSQTFAVRHTLRLLWYVYPKMDSHKVIHILTSTQPTSEHPDTIHELHALLVDRIANSNPSTPGSSQDQPSSVSSLGSSSHSPLEYIQPSST
ncbi:predicted protein [Nematostella vectensis]|uniref:Negative elongation factor B n=1 Tax=Nematostella vectensis TaxID=45351 RepID=A7T0W2_NEMVE|nr:predicted protein [Nematostella vectensis]|eukprot:XP_001622497.1 predicted protein [Nematostella vectensis]